MKKCLKSVSFVSVLVTILALIPVGRMSAQSFKTVYSFTGGSDGAFPYAGLIMSGNTLYGTARLGGSGGNGTLFKVNSDGSGFTTLHSFAPTMIEGANPFGGLILSGNTLYGTARIGGTATKAGGTVFSVNTDGTGFTILANLFGNPLGAAYPFASLTLSGNMLYGTSEGGGSHYPGAGTVFAVKTDGSTNSVVHAFSYSDGANPEGGLILSGNMLYGTSQSAGNTVPDGSGVQFSGNVFAVSTDGTAFNNLHSFSPTAGVSATNSDGAGPAAGLILVGNTLYGTTQSGGCWGAGTVFAVNTDGSGFTTLHNFSAPSGLQSTNGDGYGPVSGLLLLGNTLFGTTQLGGSYGFGTVFAMNINGTGFTTVHHFTGSASEGGYPEDGLILCGNSLYGTAYPGNGGGYGSLFSLTFQPHLTITPAGNNVILSWPTSAAGISYTGYTLQCSTNRGSAAVWNTVLPSPVVLGGYYTVTDSVSGIQKYYRLVQ